MGTGLEDAGSLSGRYALLAAPSRGHILYDLKAAFSKSQDTSIIPLKNLHDDILVTLYETLGGEGIPGGLGGATYRRTMRVAESTFI